MNVVKNKSTSLFEKPPPAQQRAPPPLPRAWNVHRETRRTPTPTGQALLEEHLPIDSEGQKLPRCTKTDTKNVSNGDGPRRGLWYNYQVLPTLAGEIYRSDVLCTNDLLPTTQLP